MPSISDLFGVDEAGESNDTELDFDKLMSSVDRSLAESTRLDVPEFESSPSSFSSETDTESRPDQGSLSHDEEGGDESEVVAPDDAPVESGGSGDEEESPTPSPLTDPLDALSPERRALLLAAEKAYESGDLSVLAPLLGQRPGRAEAEAEPELPEGIEEGTVAHGLWRQNVELQKQVARIADAQAQSAQSVAHDRARDAAGRAGATFSARYDGKLSEADVLSIAQRAGAPGGPAGLFAQGADDLAAAYDRALEYVLWTDPKMRDKVLARPAAGEVRQPAPAESTPTPSPESATRKQKLTALSSAARTGGNAPEQRSPSETRVDGRLTPQSRMALVKELSGKLRQGEG